MPPRKSVIIYSFLQGDRELVFQAEKATNSAIDQCGAADAGGRDRSQAGVNVISIRGTALKTRPCCRGIYTSIFFISIKEKEKRQDVEFITQQEASEFSGFLGGCIGYTIARPIIPGYWISAIPAKMTSKR